MTKHGYRGLLGGIALAAALAASAPALASFDGFGKDIPLDSAARQIVPEGWTVDYGDGVDSKAAVSWSSAPDWQSALKAAVAKRGYSAQIGSSTVVISKAAAAPRPYAAAPAAKPTPRASRPDPRPSAPKAAPREEAVGGGGFTIRPYHGGSASRMAVKGDFEPYDGAKAAGFAVKQGQMLHPVLSDWATAAGWNVVWDSEYDYRIEADASFGGEFIDAATALFEAMSQARPAITVDFYKGNRVVVVSNKSSDEAN